MRSFVKWVEEEKGLKPVQADATSENTKRAGISDNYPQAYAGKGYAYPDAYFMPITSTAEGKLKGKIGS
jgi:hypothetical protein